jgi:hypothetical protein
LRTTVLDGVSVGDTAELTCAGDRQHGREKRGRSNVLRWRAVRAAALAVAGALLSQPCLADETQNELWPEVDAFFKLSSRVRLFLLLAPIYSPQSWTGDETASFGELEFGPFVDVTLKPIPRRLQRADWERARYLWARVGYTHLSDFAGAPESYENRGILEITGRLPLPGAVWMVGRARVDLRDRNDAFSTRYRYRMQVERETLLFRAATVPYVNAEPFYDSRYDAVVRWRFEAGIEIALSDHWRLEPHYLRQEDSSSEPRHTNAFGLIIKSFR